MAEASVSSCSSAEEKMAAKQPPPLMKKHSQTDLVSRLKTRKILGVGGEDDDGEVHRSKVSHARKRSLEPMTSLCFSDPLQCQKNDVASGTSFGARTQCFLGYRHRLS